MMKWIGFLHASLVLLVFHIPLAWSDSPRNEGPLLFQHRSQTVTEEGIDRVDFHYETVPWDASKTAVIVCDMWDDHYCPSAAARVREMAPRMNEVLKAARNKGALIIHAPSGTMDFYEGTPARELAKEAKKPPVPEELAENPPPKKWASLDPETEPPLPIDDSDGGCPEDVPQKKVYTRQIETIEILPGDAVSDNDEIYYLLARRGIDNVVILGVHTNMCVLGRPFGIRQMVRYGKNVVLMRDMTDSMYNPAMPPQVSHFRGTELVVNHIERNWCPTVTSSDLIGGPAFRFEADNRPHISMLVSDDHYLADETLPRYAEHLRDDYGCYCTVLHGEGTANIHGIEELETTDCLIVYIRRLALPKNQLDALKRYVADGGDLIGLRTASHAFDTKGNIPEGAANWVEFDHDILGGNYHNHGSNALGTDVEHVESQENHPVLRGVQPSKWHSTGSLYWTSPIADDALLLQTGSSEQGQDEPLTWVRQRNGQRIAYSGLGHPMISRCRRFGKCWPTLSSGR